jgi:hypothetical protein
MSLLTVVGCGSGSGPAKASTYTISGAISGLTGSGLVLQNNGGSNLTVSASATSFTFPTPVPSGGAYSVTVFTQPAGLDCTVTTGSGNATANVTTVDIGCVPAYTIGGAVFGLTGNGLVLQDNGGNNLSLNATSTSYAFAFPGAVPTGGAPYSVTVLSNPSGQSCTVSGPIGVATASVTNVDVTCNTLPAVSYSIGGSISGLTGTGLILQDDLGINNNDILPLTANGAFTFVDEIPSGASYNVSVLQQPAGRNCGVTNASGTATANVSNVSILCLGEWTWLGGSNTVGPNGGQPGVYGTLGTAAPANIPGGREQGLTWIDASGNAWLFGGYGEDSTGVGYGGLLNDLWEFNPTLGTAGEWAWMGGNNVAPPSPSFGAAGAPGIYGTQGTPSPNNVPGGREEVSSWKDAKGRLWLFGGDGIDANSNNGLMNDLWMYDPTLTATGEWTWMGGDPTVPPSSLFGVGGVTGNYGTLGVTSPANLPGGRYGGISWVDSLGNFWLFSGYATDSNGAQGPLNDLWKYSPSATGDTGQWTWMGGSNVVGSGSGPAGTYGTLGTPDPSNIPGGRDAGASWTDASGNVWLFGGYGVDTNGTQGYLNDLWKYTPGASGAAGTWTWMGGSSTLPPTGQGQPGVYGALGTPSSTTIPGGRFSATTWVDASGNLWLYGGQGIDSVSAEGNLDDLWKYTPSATGDTGQWTWMGGDTTVGRTGGQSGIYGILGVPAPNNPGGRLGAPGWTDASGALWLFGGYGYDSTGAQGNLNDLWKYQP